MKGFMLSVLILVSFIANSEENQNKLSLKEIDTLLQSTQDIVCEIQVTTYNNTNRVSHKIFTYFADSSSDQFLLLCTSPVNEQGFAIIKRKDRIWSYSPIIRTFFSMKEYDFIEGTSLRIEDFLPSEYNKYYALDTTMKTKVNEIQALKLLLRAKTASSPYNNKALWLDEESLLPMREEAYDSDSHLLKIIMYSGYKRKDGWNQASSILITDMIQSNITSYININQTTLSEVPEYVFTRSFIEFITQ